MNKVSPAEVVGATLTLLIVVVGATLGKPAIMRLGHHVDRGGEYCVVRAARAPVPPDHPHRNGHTVGGLLLMVIPID